MVGDPANALRVGETITEGLDGLRERLEEYYELGARFTKWRAVIKINKSCPSDLTINANAHALARYASLVQEAKMVPIIEPEVLMNGDHNIDKCFEVTSKVLQECYRELKFHNVNLEGTILKPNMILPGDKCTSRSNVQEIAKMTLKCLKENVPNEVPGIAFLSGGQSEIEATQNLNEINKINDTDFIISFSYGRALQQGALKSWGENQEDILNTQKIFSQRSKMNGLASTGQWLKELETE
jgi:fructose-bisphosphate aldolase class I